MTSMLSFDASRAIGRAYFGSAHEMPKCRTWHGKDSWLSDDYGRYFDEAEKLIVDEIRMFNPKIVAFEAPLLLPRREGRGTDEQQVRRLVGVVSIIEKVAYQLQRECHEVNVQDTKFIAGIPSRRPKDMTYGDYKELMVIAMTKLGYEVADDHQADAAAVARVVYDQLGEL